MHIIFKIRDATIAARARTGDKTIATDVEKGVMRVIRVTYDAKGKSTVKPVAVGLTPDAAVKFLEAL